MITPFTPLFSLIGGALIGLSAVGLMAMLGRVAGMTGIARGVIPPWTDGEQGWRLAFLVGAIIAPVILLVGGWGPVGFSAPAPLWSLPLSGVLAGIGTTYGNGCPSGHGICGLARLSPRSLAAVVTFMATAAITVFLSRHVFGG